jgi:hypothetical protein
MMAHSLNQTVGVFWLNAAETWVDVEKKATGGVVNVRIILLGLTLLTYC